MLAVSDRREIRALDAGQSPLERQTPRHVFRAAYTDLCTRIWVELEQLAHSAEQVACGRPQDLDTTTEILRLELVVLVDSCRSPHWRHMLTEDQCDRLCSMLTDVLAALYVDSEQLSLGVADAQDRVLIELEGVVSYPKLNQTV